MLILELLQPADLHHAHHGELFLPPVARRLGYTQLAADLLYVVPLSVCRGATQPAVAGPLFPRYGIKRTRELFSGL